MKKEWEIYRDTGMLGAYEKERAILLETENGGVGTLFRDTTYWDKEEGRTQTREMIIQGRRFLVTSVFPGDGKATPTEKLLRYIDSELEKEAHSV